MKSLLSRRDFLKLISALSITQLLDLSPIKLPLGVNKIQSDQLPNVVIILFDALSARHLSLLGYNRQTTPNLERFAQKGIVYHFHHSPANFTTPSTASLFTGTYPWTHRALHFSGTVKKELVSKNMFASLGERYNRVGFAHNLLADLLLFQFNEYIDRHVDIGRYNHINSTIYNNVFPNDAIPGFRSFDELLLRGETPGSMFYSLPYHLSILAQYKYYQESYTSQYPNGLPNAGNPGLTFVLEPLFEGIMGLLSELQSPYFAYIHLFPPHEPYYPKKKFLAKFHDDWNPVRKEQIYFSEGYSNEKLDQLRRKYDQYVAHTDDEFGRLFDYMEKIGLLETSYIIVTSDHGQLFERGVHGHSTPLLYESVIHIPLLISRPQQNHREDIYTPTSTIDLLPTLHHLTGDPIPDWSEGQVLPGLGGEESPQRSIFSIEAKRNPARHPLSQGTIALIKGRYKLIHYLGYPGYDNQFELYDLENDPEEIQDLYRTHPMARELKAELQEELYQNNQLYINDG